MGVLFELTVFYYIVLLLIMTMTFVFPMFSALILEQIYKQKFVKPSPIQVCRI